MPPLFGAQAPQNSDWIVQKAQPSAATIQKSANLFGTPKKEQQNTD